MPRGLYPLGVALFVLVLSAFIEEPMPNVMVVAFVLIAIGFDGLLSTYWED